MDYNINRLDVQDKKGLEVALVMTLSAMLDQEYDERIAARGERNLYICTSGIPTDLSAQGYTAAWREAEMRHHAKTVHLPSQSSGSPMASAGDLPRRAVEEVDVATMDRIANLEPNEMLVTSGDPSTSI